MIRGIHQNLDQQPAPAFFVRGPSPLARLTFFTALSLALMATDSRLNYLSSFRQQLVTLLHPLQVLANAPSNAYQFSQIYFSTHFALLNENKQLKQQALTLNANLQQLNTLKRENDHLRQLLEAQQNLTPASTLAEIEYVGRDAFTRKIIVNRGSNHHIMTGAAAVDAKGVIGQVTRTYPSSSEVTLITDKSLSIPVQIERNGLRAIAFGHGRDNTLDLPYLPANVDIKRGDKLVTSGIDGIYPTGLTVAVVSEITSYADSPFARIVCVPAAGTESNRHVLLVSLAKADSNPTIPVNAASTNTQESAKKPNPNPNPNSGEPNARQ